MEVKVGKIVGRMDGRQWGQVHDFSPAAAADNGGTEEQGETTGDRGRLIAVMGICREEAEQLKLVETGREILGRVHEMYYGSGETALSALKRAVETVVEEFEGVEAGGVVIKEGVVYVVAGEGMGVWVKAGEREGWLIDPKIQNTGEASASRAKFKIQSFSGRAVEGEVIVMGNGRFWTSVPFGTMRMVVAGLNGEMETAVETLLAVEHGSEKGGGEVGTIIKISDIRSQILGEPKTLPDSGVTSGINLGQRIRGKAGRVWGSVWGRLKLSKPGVVYVAYQDKAAARKRTRYAGVGFLVAALLLVGAGKIQKRRTEVKLSEERVLVEKVVQEYEEARSLIGMNPTRSRQLLAKVEGDLKVLEEKKVKDARIEQVKQTWGEVLGAASGVKKIQAREVVDLGLVREGMRGTAMVKVGNKLWVTDSQGGRLVEVNSGTGAVKIAAGEESLGKPQTIAAEGEKLAILSDKGVIQCSMINVQCSVVVEKDKEWGEIKDMQLFGGNIYLLESTGKIWKYPGGDAGFGEKREWTKEAGGGQNMAIDGSIWVVKTDKVEIMKFALGERESWGVSGLDKELGEGARIYTSAEAEKLYILDRANGRVVQLKKNGEYEGQMTGGELAGAEDMVADKGGKKIYWIGGSKVWEAEL